MINYDVTKIRTFQRTLENAKAVTFSPSTQSGFLVKDSEISESGKDFKEEN